MFTLMITVHEVTSSEALQDRGKTRELQGCIWPNEGVFKLDMKRVYIVQLMSHSSFGCLEGL